MMPSTYENLTMLSIGSTAMVVNNLQKAGRHYTLHMVVIICEAGLGVTDVSIGEIA
jgi:hypothetical protein